VDGTASLLDAASILSLGADGCQQGVARLLHGIRQSQNVSPLTYSCMNDYLESGTLVVECYIAYSIPWMLFFIGKLKQMNLKESPLGAFLCRFRVPTQTFFCAKCDLQILLILTPIIGLTWRLTCDSLGTHLGREVTKTYMFATLVIKCDFEMFF